MPLELGQSDAFSSCDKKTEPVSSITTIKSETTNAANHSIEQKNTFSYNGKKIQYLLILPAGYSQNTNQWPLIFFLHGSSGRGSDLNLVKEYGPPFIAEEQLRFPFIVLAPQCPEDEYWTSNSDMLAALLDDILKRYRIDQDRVYLTGQVWGEWYLASDLSASRILCSDSTFSF